MGLSHRLRVVAGLVSCWDLPGRPALFWGETGRKDAERTEEMGKEYGGVEEGQPVLRCTVSENNREMFYKNYDRMLIK